MEQHAEPQSKREQQDGEPAVGSGIDDSSLGMRREQGSHESKMCETLRVGTHRSNGVRLSMPARTCSLLTVVAASARASAAQAAARAQLNAVLARSGVGGEKKSVIRPPDPTSRTTSQSCSAAAIEMVECRTMTLSAVTAGNRHGHSARYARGVLATYTDATQRKRKRAKQTLRATGAIGASLKSQMGRMPRQGWPVACVRDKKCDMPIGQGVKTRARE